MFYDTFESPIGSLTIAGTATRICELHIEGDRYFSTIPPSWNYWAENPLFKNARGQLKTYFKGEHLGFNLPLAFDGTDFQKLVWQQLQDIPPGQTRTYAELAIQIGKPGAVRAAGTAVGRNRLCILIPCHRVIASSGGLGGCVAGLDRKKYLLQLEGAGS